ncbi:uncharacterized protein L201_003047 [Kwoniella dendrophila CBS 6074]|uniref:Alpha-ketoglutarate-dependent dioxygenase AlkB-like domain-containing protein n=1 Tax=Kwoniella dendrophila CBS 6074 TaxID=1295534 RepID=A0AAX4JRW0_9TREE
MRTPFSQITITPKRLIRSIYSQTSSSSFIPKPLNLYSQSPLIRSHPQSRNTSFASALDITNEEQNGSLNDALKPDDFLFWPNFFTNEECKVLTEMALWKLDRIDTSLKRRRKGRFTPKLDDEAENTDEIQKLFDREYGFEEGHYDSVIHQYRETLLSSLPPSPSSSLTSSLIKLYSLLPDLPIDNLKQEEIPPKGTITHLLHLSPKGEILPHVDNLQASGKFICGVSLGSERTLRLQSKDKDKKEGWDVRLGNGSVYLQRDSIRYNYEHSILPYDSEGSVWDGEQLKPGHRISIMIRDTPKRPAEL